ncbi:uncharacterized protein LOC123302730 [Chrysoperla carnea]|uniref:uncharacterized protein LOC123302730 n=1 Tax=Chrysoperla carnea TaxID=189513 RepID=UPI001D07D4E3|nr:uncharacterized protein LOC123302730 [Chrysoperla carnea]
MQVATLFRETANLLGASMESASSNGASTGSCSPPNGLNSHRDSVYTRPTHLDRYKPMSNENQDDGYETSADLVLGGGMGPHSTNLDHLEDPYSFVDDSEHAHAHAHANAHAHAHGHGHGHPHAHAHAEQNRNNMLQMSQQMQHNYMSPPNNMLMDPNSMIPAPRKRGRKKKIKLDADGNITTIMKIKEPGKERKKHDRFNGMPEEEVSKRTLPDHLTQNLDIIIIGINPGLFAAYKGHHYAGPGNHFWKCLYLSGLTPEQMSADEDYKLLQVGIGFTNMVQRATKGSADLTRKEIKEGSQILLEKLQHFKPKIAVFNGKLIYEVFSGKKDFCFGRQPDLIDGTNTYMWVMPSSSARCAQLPRAADKVPFYAALKKFRDYLNGMVAMIDESEVVFSEARIKSSFCENEMSQNELIDISNAKRDEDGSIVPCKKKRGRPKKIKIDGEEALKPQPVKRIYNPQINLNVDGTKKKRGRPKKIRVDGMTMVGDDHQMGSDPSKMMTHLHDVDQCNDVDQMNKSNEYNMSHLKPQQHTPSQMYSNTPTPTPTPTPSLQHLPPYIQSPRPQSQPFTHSDLSSEISAAISSEHLESPAPTSPSLDAPDFDPPTNMPTEDTTECCFSSPTPSTNSAHEQQTTPPMIRPLPYSAYNNYSHSPDPQSQQHNTNTQLTSVTNVTNVIKPEYKVQDMSTKSLSGLESLVDQIPNITDGETNTVVQSNHHQTLDESVTGGGVTGSNGQNNSSYSVHEHQSSPSNNTGSTSNNNSSSSSLNFSYPGAGAASNHHSNQGGLSSSQFSFTSNYMNSPVTNNYSNLMGGMGGMHTFMEHHNCGMPAVPVPLSYHGTPHLYGTPQPYSHSSYGSLNHGTSVLHMPSPNYPNGYSYSGAAAYASTPPTGSYHHMFDHRLKPDTGGMGYGSF